MPYRSMGDNFVGRVSDLWQVHDLLHQGRTAVVQGVGVVMGTGGLGKTQLAIEYVHRMGSQYPGGVFWVEAERGIASMVGQITPAAGLDIDGALPVHDQLAALWRQLSQFPPTLVVLDNFPESEPLQPWLPVSGPMHTLVTTRRRD